MKHGRPRNMRVRPDTGRTDRRKWYALAVVIAVGLFNYIDRLSMSILQVPIKAELGLSDSQIGVLTGLAFSLVYTTLTIPIARLADRVPRRYVIAAALATWSSMTALCGLASGFLVLAVFRMGVAIGEAGCVPATHATISDHFPPHRRGMAMSTYSLVLPVGTLLGFMSSGWLAEVFGWRRTFVVLGILGLLLVPVVLVGLREPLRRETDGHAAPAGGESLGTTLLGFWRSHPLRYLLLGCALISYPLHATLVWNAAFYDRQFGMPLAEMATYLALLSGVGGGIGLYFSGILADRLGRIDTRWYLWVPAVAGLLTLPALFAQYVLAPSAHMSFAVGFVAAMLTNTFVAPMSATAQSLVLPNQRALVAACVVCIAGFLGTVLGPLLTGIFSDVFSQYLGLGRDGLRYALLLGGVVSSLGALLLFHGARELPAEYSRLRAGAGPVSPVQPAAPAGAKP